MKQINENEIKVIEKLLLPNNAEFDSETKSAIMCFESKDFLACPGNGKTTMLLAKLKLLSDRMPLENKQAICVLSHTNIAINEIKTKLKSDAKKLLSYPNYIGTIHKFVNKFITLPYLNQKYSLTVNVISANEYHTKLIKLCRADNLLKYLFEKQLENSKKYHDLISYIKSLHIGDDGLYSDNKKIAGLNTKAYPLYKKCKERLLSEYGLVTYEESLLYALEAVEEHANHLKKLLPARFQYVFIDEYQDCCEKQRKIIDVLFTDTTTVVQRIGDIDQAIYNNVSQENSTWIPSKNVFHLNGSHRYGDEIANILNKLRTCNGEIYTSQGKREILPYFLVYDAPEHVTNKFIQIIKQNKLHIKYPNGVFKAIGMCQNVSGLKISDYWSEYNDFSENSFNRKVFSDYNELLAQLSDGNLFIAEKLFREILSSLLAYHDVYDEQQIKSLGKKNRFTASSIKTFFKQADEIEYTKLILSLTKEEYYNNLLKLLEEVLNVLIPKKAEHILESFRQLTESSEFSNLSTNNIYTNDSVSVKFSTIHKVKGETHTATLYLETEKNRGSDIKRILYLLEDKKLPSPSMEHKRARKCSYVAMSRPSHLLCVALQRSTYNLIKNKDKFSDWNIVEV